MEQRLIDANKIYSEVQNSASDIDTEKDMKALFRYLLRTAQTVLTIPDNPTNGNMIKAMFPNAAIRVVTESQIGISFFNNQNEITWIPIDWWNAPYKKRGDKV